MSIALPPLLTSIPDIPNVSLIRTIFTIAGDGVPICKPGLRMHKDGYEAARHRAKYRCPKANRRHCSIKMWYCRLCGIMMLQHLDAWEMPSADILFS